MKKFGLSLSFYISKISLNALKACSAMIALTYALYPWSVHCKYALTQKQWRNFNYPHLRDVCVSCSWGETGTMRTMITRGGASQIHPSGVVINTASPGRVSIDLSFWSARVELLHLCEHLQDHLRNYLWDNLPDHLRDHLRDHLQGIYQEGKLSLSFY